MGKILKEGMVRRSEFDCIVIHVQVIFRHFEKKISQISGNDGKRKDNLTKLAKEMIAI
jgi:hypothetical protein